VIKTQATSIPVYTRVGMVNYKKLSDAALVELIAGKKDKAFEELYQRYNGKLYHYFCRMCGDKIKAQDLLQDLFLKLINKAHLFNKRYSFSTWFYTIAYHQYINQVRRKSLMTDPPAQTDKDDILHSFAEDFDMESNLDRRMFREQVNAFLNQVDEEKRNTFILRYQQDLNITEIAEVMNCPPGTVKSRLHYLLKEIGSRLSAYQDI